MRTYFPVLLLALAAALPLRAESAPELILEASPDREFYRTDATNKIYLALRLADTSSVDNPPAIPAPAEPTASVPPPQGNYAFVLDRSGSMAGEPVTALRAALAATLRELRPHDLVSIIVFGSEVETLLEATPRASLPNLDALLAKIEPAGGAALYDALNQGAAQLRRQAGPGTDNHLVLLTDGPATKGPREPVDFAKLAEAFARENITLSTIGLGPDFNEDLLASLARTGRGNFRFAHQPATLADAFAAELGPRRNLIARHLVLTLRLMSDSEDLVSYGWHTAELNDHTVTYHIPTFYAGEELNLLVSTIVRGRQHSTKLGTLTLQWLDPRTGQSRELTRAFEVYFESDIEAYRKSQFPAATRILTRTLISEGLQEAIEQLDKGDPRRALRALRNARSDAHSLNYHLEDPAISAQIKLLEAFLAEVEPRGLTAADRKRLRSGLGGRFDPPTADEEPADARAHSGKSP